MSRFRFLHPEQATFPVSTLCRVRRVSRAGYYAWAGRPPTTRSLKEKELSERIAVIHQESRQCCGVPRVHASLQAAGEHVSRKRVARLMRAAGLRGKTRRRARPRTTVADGAATPAPNRVQRQFQQATVNRLWVGDMTYLRTDEGWLYLATLLDACSRCIVGWALADHLRPELPLEALRLALGQRRPAPGQLTHHTDRGSQYTAHAYQAVLEQHSVPCSMSRKGDCYDNAVAESFFATLKNELVERSHWPMRKEARRAVFEWITVCYNRQRRHSALGYRSPVEFEATLPRVLAA